MKELPKYTKQFLNYLSIEKQASPLTVRDYTHYLKNFSQWVNKNYPDSQLSDIDMKMISAYRVYLSEKFTRKKRLQKVTQNYYIICLRSFLRYLLKNDVKTLEPSKIELPRTSSKSLKFLDRVQMDKLLQMPDVDTLWGLRDRTILELMFSTGLRLSEVYRLNRDSVNLTRMEFSIIGKGNKSRLVFISEAAGEWLRIYLDKREDNYKPLFIRYSQTILEDNNGEKMRLAKRGIQRMVDEYSLKAGIPFKVSPHVLRHSFATDLLTNGANVLTVSQLLGHSNIATTQIYMHVTNNQLREAHRKFHRA